MKDYLECDECGKVIEYEEPEHCTACNSYFHSKCLDNGDCPICGWLVK